jgi:HB1/ASXL restriction endonuclease-like protein with HTH domain
MGRLCGHVMRDSYLEAARVVLRARGKPLSAREILYEARKYGFLPPHLHGVTMHKTLQARLSEDILEHRLSSAFYRTSPGIFFLRELSNDPNISSKITNEFLATRRQKSVPRHRVLCAPMQIVRGLPSPTNKVTSFLDLFGSEAASYVLKEIANLNPNLAQLATFCSVIMNKKILAHQVGAYASACRFRFIADSHSDGSRTAFR